MVFPFNILLQRERQALLDSDDLDDKILPKKSVTQYQSWRIGTLPVICLSPYVTNWLCSTYSERHRRFNLILSMIPLGQIAVRSGLYTQFNLHWFTGVAVFSLGNILNFISFGYAAQVTLVPCLSSTRLCLSRVFTRV